MAGGAVREISQLLVEADQPLPSQERLPPETSAVARCEMERDTLWTHVQNDVFLSCARSLDGTEAGEVIPKIEFLVMNDAEVTV